MRFKILDLGIPIILLLLCVSCSKAQQENSSHENQYMDSILLAMPAPPPPPPNSEFLQDGTNRPPPPPIRDLNEPITMADRLNRFTKVVESSYVKIAHVVSYKNAFAGAIDLWIDLENGQTMIPFKMADPPFIFATKGCDKYQVYSLKEWKKDGINAILIDEGRDYLLSNVTIEKNAYNDSKVVIAGLNSVKNEFSFKNTEGVPIQIIIWTSDEYKNVKNSGIFLEMIGFVECHWLPSGLVTKIDIIRPDLTQTVVELNNIEKIKKPLSFKLYLREEL